MFFKETLRKSVSDSDQLRSTAVIIDICPLEGKTKRLVNQTNLFVFIRFEKEFIAVEQSKSKFDMIKLFYNKFE